jgi:hypothetical protein
MTSSAPVKKSTRVHALHRALEMAASIDDRQLLRAAFMEERRRALRAIINGRSPPVNALTAVGATADEEMAVDVDPDEDEASDHSFDCRWMFACPSVGNASGCPCTFGRRHKTLP